MPFWSGPTLRRKLQSLIVPYREEQIDCAAYTMTMGGEVYVSPDSDAEPSQQTIRILTEAESFVIPPGQFAFLLTAETVAIPDDAIAFISIKATLKFRGLVNVSGFHVDPGYSGRLVYAVYNAGPKAVHIREGENCFLIWFADLDLASGSDAKARTGWTRIDADIVNNIGGAFETIAGLSKRIDDQKAETTTKIHAVEKEQQVTRTLLVALLPVALTLVIHSCTEPAGVTAAANRAAVVCSEVAKSGQRSPGRPALIRKQAAAHKAG